MKNKGLHKWLALLAAIIALEAIPGPTLTQSHLDALSGGRKNKLKILVIHTFIISHLWGLLPRQYDPLTITANGIRNYYNQKEIK